MSIVVACVCVRFFACVVCVSLCAAMAVVAVCMCHFVCVACVSMFDCAFTVVAVAIVALSPLIALAVRNAVMFKCCLSSTKLVQL